MEDDWNDYDRYKVAEMLMQEYPRLSIDKLLAAIRECGSGVKRSEGIQQLADCTKAHLVKTRGTGMGHGAN